MSVLDVLPVRGVDAEVWSQDGDIVLSTPCGHVVLEYSQTLQCWEVLQDEVLVESMRTLEQCLWLVIGLYGEGLCNWDELHGRLFGGE